jgi:hypothetical protein
VDTVPGRWLQAASALNHPHHHREMGIKLVYALLLLTLAAPRTALAHDFPTSGRVEYVLECMQKHDSKYEYLYKCSCVIDHIAKDLPYDEYVAMSTALRNQTMAGERGAMFRDPPPVKEMANKYQALQASANKACYIKP